MAYDRHSRHKVSNEAPQKCSPVGRRQVAVTNGKQARTQTEYQLQRNRLRNGQHFVETTDEGEAFGSVDRNVGANLRLQSRVKPTVLKSIEVL